MSRVCAINASKAVLTGHKVSHSNIKTKRRFLPNLQAISFMSEALGRKITLRITPNTIRSIEHNDGLDNYLMTTANSKLTLQAKKLKKKISKALKSK